MMTSIPKGDSESAHKSHCARPEPYAGLRVVEFSHMVMGPTCGMILADMGAEVIKVESADAPTRHDAGFLPTMAASTSRRISMNST